MSPSAQTNSALLVDELQPIALTGNVPIVEERVADERSNNGINFFIDLYRIYMIRESNEFREIQSFG